MMNNHIRIRVADLTDKARIEIFLGQINLLSGDVLAKNTQYWVAEGEDHVLAGCAGLEFGVDTALLRSVAVLPDFRNMGLGCNLVSTAMNTAQAMGYKTIFLFSVSSGSYWQKMGFHKIPVDELVQSLPEIPQVLRFAEIGKLATEIGWKKELT